MSKRPVEAVIEDGSQAYLKRQKIKHVSTVPAETIQSSRQLQQVLSFDQNTATAKHGIQSFKTFLEGFKEDDRNDRLNILKEYLILQKPQDAEDKTAVYLEDIMQTWSFASQSNEESLLSLIPATLTLLFKTISGALDFSEFGLLLGRTLLKKRQLELFARSLLANKTKAFLISPSLCLLREILLFDGGALATQFFRVRDGSLKGLARNLGVRYLGEGVESKARPSVRTNAMLLFCTCVKLFTTDARKELLLQRDIISALTREISHDPPYLILETLEVLKTHVLHDEKLPRDSKSRLLNPASLGRLVTLYNYDIVDDEQETNAKSVPDAVHEFLMSACTSNEKGVLYRQAGFYPKGIDPDAEDVDDSQKFINLGLESIEWSDRFHDKVPVRNTTLSEFIQTLRPWSSPKQAELLLAIFKAAPELVADYFINKKSFTFEPKLTATWIGYAAFLYSTIGLPMPVYFGHKAKYGRLPPPSSIVIQSILPLPLTQKILTKCLSNASALIRFFVLRILIIAFEKLGNFLRHYRTAAKEFPIWQQASERLVREFSARCPAIKDVLGAFRVIPAEDLMTRHAASKLLVMYYEVVPQTALEAKFDISTALTQILTLLDGSAEESKDFALRFIEAENLFQVAYCSPGMRWFNKADSRPISPFTTMLRLAAQAPPNVPLSRMRFVLQSIIEESGVLQTSPSQSSLEALLAALRSIKDSPSADAAYAFLDDCALRCSAAPIKYIDSLEKLQLNTESAEKGDTDNPPLSLLSITITEQWPFAVKSTQSPAIETLATFISSWFAASIKLHENKKVLKTLIKTCASESGTNATSKAIIESSRKLADAIEIKKADERNVTFGDAKVVNEDTDERSDIYSLMADYNPRNVDDHSAILKWTGKEIEEVMEDGHASALIMLLSSEYLATRKEALTNVFKLAAKLKESSYEEKEQMWLLLLEVSETAKPNIELNPLPTTISAFAANAVNVLKDPLHCLYPKLNKFLTQGPTWELDKLPLMHGIMDESPSLDDAYYREIDWLLSYLMEGLKTPDDLAIYHKRHVFEKLLSFYNNVYAGQNLKEKILKIVYLCTKIEGGSTTLVTRFSILSWLQVQIVNENETTVLRTLRERILETCAGDKLKAWSQRAVADLAM